MIHNDEILHKAIKSKPQFWNTKTDSISSALFKDSQGVSVDRNANRSDEEVKYNFLTRFPDLKGEARLKTELCRDKGCRVHADPTEHNENHALILGENKIELTKGQAKYLSRNCEVIKYYSGLQMN